MEHWLIIARHGEGKSTFAAQMSPDYLVADLDGRWEDQNPRGKSHVIKVSDPLEMVDEMEKLRKSVSGVGTVIYDSGTAVMDFFQSRGRLMEQKAKAEGRKFNLNDIHRTKADTMRMLRLAALKWHCSVLWIFHTEDRMNSGEARVRTSIPKTELEVMKSNLHAVLTIVKDKNGKRGIRVEWCRFNNGAATGQIIWDHEGMWLNVPQKLSVLLRSFKGDEGYNGNGYGVEWLWKFLDGKGIKFKSMDEMRKKLEIEKEPLWFDKNAWTVFINRAGA